MNNYNLTYSKPKHLCEGTNDCENVKAKPHACPYEMTTAVYSVDYYEELCTCCRECEVECLEMMIDERKTS